MVIALLLLCWLTILGSISAAAWYIRRSRAEISDILSQFVTSADETTPSPFAQLVVSSLSGAIPGLAAGVTQSLKASFMGQASAMAKSIDGIEGDIAGDALASRNPGLAALIEFSPSLAKRLKRSPAAALALSQLNLGGMLGGKPAPVASSSYKSNGSSQLGF